MGTHDDGKFLKMTWHVGCPLAVAGLALICAVCVILLQIPVFEAVTSGMVVQLTGLQASDSQNYAGRNGSPQTICCRLLSAQFFEQVYQQAPTSQQINLPESVRVTSAVRDQAEVHEIVMLMPSTAPLRCRPVTPPLTLSLTPRAWRMKLVNTSCCFTCQELHDTATGAPNALRKCHHAVHLRGRLAVCLLAPSLCLPHVSLF